MLTQFESGAPVMVGACGICCNVCRLYASGVCEGCPRDNYPVEKVLESACAILRCAAAKRVSFCTHDCSDYPCVLYRHGLPICERNSVVGSQILADQMLPDGTQVGLRITRPERGPQFSERGPQLYIFCLGPFRVVRNGKDITEAEWGQTKGPTQKVKALLAYLLAKGSRGATKDEIVELLWGNQPASDKGDARFHAAIYYLRRALEPGLPPRAESQYILYEDSFYRLAPPGGYWVDAAAFEAYYQHALRLDEEGQGDIAARYWKLAEALYQGDYMTSLAPVYTEDYLDCCQWQRCRLKDMYRLVLLKLAHYHFQCNQDRLSLTYAQKALAEDRGCEEAHCLIMKLKHRVGQRDELTRQYHLCERTLAEVEDRRPSPETVQLYQRLLHATSP